MRLTVVIPVHGATAELVDCLAALTESTERPDEVIVVDDGSPEWAGEQIAAAAERAGARCLRQARQGPAAARNRGARASAGELLMFVDADVRVWPCALEEEKTDLPRFLDRPHLASPANISGGPAAVVCTSFTESGLPLGAQLIGAPFQDARVLALAAALEHASGTRSRRPALAA